MSKLVSVIIPSHPNRIEQRKKVVRMVKKQTYPNLEIIVETGGNNAQEARNIGIRKAKGKYIAMLDDDDAWHPNKIKEQVKVMEENPDCGICITWARDLRLQDKGIEMDYTPKKEITYSDMLRGFAIAPTSTFLIREKCIDELGGFREDFRFAHEYELALRYAKHGWRILCIQKYLTYYGKYSSSRLSDNYSDYIRGHFDLLRVYGKDMAKESIIFSLLRQTACIPLFFIGIFNRNLMHKFFYRFKRLHTQGRL